MVTDVFQLLESKREKIVNEHLFYFKEARGRLLTQFSSIDAESDAKVEQHLENNEKYYDPDFHDESDLYNDAFNAGIDHYQLVSDMHNDVRLALVGGIFHQWDKELRALLAKESKFFNGGDATYEAIWRANFVDIIDLLEGINFNVRSKPYYSTLDAHRLVVNVYKHGDGTALNTLNRDYPDYLSTAFGVGAKVPPGLLRHDCLRVTDTHFENFSQAIVAFWKDIPGKVTIFVNKPEWLSKALAKDAKS